MCVCVCVRLCVRIHLTISHFSLIPHRFEFSRYWFEKCMSMSACAPQQLRSCFCFTFLALINSRFFGIVILLSESFPCLRCILSSICSSLSTKLSEAPLQCNKYYALLSDLLLSSLISCLTESLRIRRFPLFFSSFSSADAW